MSLAAIASGWLGRICAFGLLVVCAALVLVPRLAAVDQKRDAKAEEIAHAMMQSLGGEKAWYAAHFVRFDFNVNMGGKQVAGRSHLWDKMTGRYRLEEKTKAGKSQVTLFNVNDRQGAVYLDGTKLEGAPAAKALKDAYGAHINDMYWLAMPWKWMDPGANLKYMGPKTRDGETDDVVRLTFNHVGLTPGDRYDAFVSNQSHLMTHWEYKLQSGQSGAWDWQYGDYNGVKLAKDHTSSDHKMSIGMGDVRVLDRVDDAYFSDPVRMLAGLK